MKTILLKFSLTLFLFHSLSSSGKGIDSLKYSFSFNYYRDLSDTYGGGNLLSGEFKYSKSWYGASVSYSHFQSQSTFIFKVLVEEINKTVETPIEEMAIMQMGALSCFLRPIQKKWIDIDILIGFVFGKAQSSIFKSLDYNYSFIENRFTYLYRDYQLIKRNHFGYQAGFDVSIFITKKFGLQLNSRMQHLSNGGSFFFAGSGVCFRF